MIFNGEMLLYYQKMYKNQYFQNVMIRLEVAGTIKISQKYILLSRYDVLELLWNIYHQYGHIWESWKNLKKSIFLFSKNWWKIVNGRFFKKYVPGQNDCFTSRSTLMGPPNPPISTVTTTHPCMYITLFIFWKMAQNRLFFTFSIKNHLIT